MSSEEEKSMSFSNLQAVTVKEALSTKARHLRRSLSTPNVHNVSSPAAGLFRPSDSSQGLGCGKSGESGQGLSAGRITFGPGVGGPGVGIPGCQACASVLEVPTREPLQVTGLKGVCVCVLLSYVWLFCDPVDCSPPGSTVHGNSPDNNAGASCHSLLQGIFPTPGIQPGFPALQTDSLPSEPPGKPQAFSGILQISPHRVACPWKKFLGMWLACWFNDGGVRGPVPALLSPALQSVPTCSCPKDLTVSVIGRQAPPCRPSHGACCLCWWPSSTNHFSEETQLTDTV